MKIVLLAFVILFIFRYIQAKNKMWNMNKHIEFYLSKIQREIDADPEEPLLYCRRGSLYQQLQNFPKAFDDFNHARILISNGCPVTEKDKLLTKLEINIKFTKKPLPWSKNGPKDHSGSALYYLLIDRLGALRYQF